MKNRFVFLFLSLFLFAASGMAQNGLPSSPGARGLAMGLTGVTFRDINSAFANPAGLAFLDHFSATAIGERRFLISDIQSFSAAIALPASSGAFALTGQFYGFEAYQEQKAGLTYARRLADGFSIGTQFLLFNTRIPEYGNKMVFSFEAGLQAQLFPELSLGVRVFNPVRISIAENEVLPTLFNVGFAYEPSEKVVLNAEVEKDIDFPVRAKAGIEYHIIDALAFRTGVATNPTSLAFGIGYSLSGGLAIDIASSYHQVLGFTPAVSIIFAGKQKTNNDAPVDGERFFP